MLPLWDPLCLQSALPFLLQLGELISHGASAASQALSRPGDWVRPHRSHSQVHSLSHSTVIFIVGLNKVIHVSDEQELQEAGRGYQPSYNVLPQTFNTIPGVSILHLTVQWFVNTCLMQQSGLYLNACEDKIHISKTFSIWYNFRKGLLWGDFVVFVFKS